MCDIKLLLSNNFGVYQTLPWRLHTHHQLSMRILRDLEPNWASMLWQGLWKEVGRFVFCILKLRIFLTNLWKFNLGISLNHELFTYLLCERTFSQEYLAIFVICWIQTNARRLLPLIYFKVIIEITTHNIEITT